jgi:hypothetical protein
MFDSDEYEAEQSRLEGIFWRMGDFGYGDQRYLIDGFLPETGLVILAGDPKVGKTALASAIALAVAKGRPFAGMQTQQRSVLWLCLEESHQERAAVMRRARGLSRLPLYITTDRIPIDTEQGIYELDHWVRSVEAGLIVIDPLHAAHSGRSLQDGWAARKTLRLLKHLSKSCLILVLHHLAKRGASRVAESVQLSAIATMVIILRPVGVRELARAFEPESAGSELARLRSRRSPRVLQLDCTGRGDFANKTWRFISRNPLDYRIATKDIPVIPNSLAAKILAILNRKKGLCARTIATQLNKSVSTIRNELTALRKIGLVAAEKLSYVTYYKLARAKK